MPQQSKSTIKAAAFGGGTGTASTAAEALSLLPMLPGATKHFGGTNKRGTELGRGAPRHVTGARNGGGFSAKVLTRTATSAVINMRISYHLPAMCRARGRPKNGGTRVDVCRSRKKGKNSAPREKTTEAYK